MAELPSPQSQGAEMGLNGSHVLLLEFCLLSHFAGHWVRGQTLVGASWLRLLLEGKQPQARKGGRQWLVFLGLD